MSASQLLLMADGLQYIYRSTRRAVPGQVLLTSDGRVYRYGEVGATAIAAGRLAQAELPETAHDLLAIPAAVGVGIKNFNITNGATTITLNQYQYGYLNIDDDAGEGHIYRIESHAAEAAGSTDFEVVIEPPGIRVALTTATTVSLTKHPLRDVIIHPSPPTALPVGVTPTTAPVDNFGFFQIRGLASVLVDSYTGAQLAIGVCVFASGAVDGAVGVGRATIRTGSTSAGDETSFTNIETFTGTELGAAIANVAVDTNVALGVVIDPPVGIIHAVTITNTEEIFVNLIMH